MNFVLYQHTQKIKLIDALSETGLKNIQVCSFVNPNLVPGWADAEQVVEDLSFHKDIKYSGLYFNDKGLDRALKYKDKLTLSGSISLTASENFYKKKS